MPGLDGMELLRWGREHAPGTIWIILSGLDTFDSAVEAIRLGAFDFLAKPPRVAELEVAVRNALERRALLLERERLHAELRTTNQRLWRSCASWRRSPSACSGTWSAPR
jgi:DNA-binding NtrC family response regulator